MLIKGSEANNLSENVDSSLSLQWSRTNTVHSDRDELIMFIKFLFPYHISNFHFDVTIQSPRTLNDRIGHLKCEVIE